MRFRQATTQVVPKRSAIAGRGHLAALVGATTWLGAAVTHAGEPERVHLAYEAPADCPSEGEFLDLVARDGGVLARAADGEPVRSLAVTVHGTVPIEGQLAVRGVDGTRAVRSITGERCEDVVRAIAVLAVLYLEPGSPSPPRPVATVDPEDATPATQAHPASSETRAPGRWRIAVSAEGTVEGGVFPGALPGIAGYVEVLRDTRDAFAPSLRVGAAMTATGTVKSMGPPETAFGTTLNEGPLGETVFQKYAARFDACPWRVLASQPWSRDALSAQACARFEAGVLDVHAAQFVDSLTLRRAWAAVSPLLRLRWTFPSVFFELQGGAVFPLLRERFVVHPSTQVFEVPAATGASGIGLGALFP